MSKCILLSLFLLFSTAAFSNSDNNSRQLPRVGTYLGFLKLVGKDVKIPVSLDFEKEDPVNGEESRLLAFLKLMFGGFNSNEYITYFYVVPKYKWDNPVIKLDGNRYTEVSPTNDISLLNGLVQDDGDTLKGNIRFAKGSFLQGEIQLIYFENEASLQKLDSIYPEAHIMPPITGQFEGECGYPVILQFESIKAKSFESSSPLYPYLGYEIRDRYGYKRWSRLGYLSGSSSNAAGFDFYSSELTIPSFWGRVCEVKRDGIVCDNCTLSRVSKENYLDRLLIEKDFKRPERKFHFNELNAASPINYPYNDEQLDGSYFGYLHIEGRDIYELLSLEVSFTALEEHLISIIGRAYVGSGDIRRTTTLPITFLSVPFTKEPFTSFVLISKDDTVLKITNWNSLGMMGVLYSKTSGRVGTFELLKGIDPNSQEFQKSHPRAKPLQGKYHFSFPGGDGASKSKIKGYTIDIKVTAGRTSSELAFFPFNITGSIIYHLVTYGDYRFPIHAGFYDPFNGTFLLKADSQQVIVGKLFDDGIKAFVSGTTASETPFQEHRWFFFKRL